MTKAHSTIHDNGGRCESCDRPETVYMGQTTIPVYLAGGLGWGTMWVCPDCRRKKEEHRRLYEPTAEELEQNRQG